MLKKLTSVFLAVVIMMGVLSVTITASEDTNNSELKFSDMPENWSTTALKNAVNNGLLQGADGKILPNEHLTRAELATIMNRSFKSYKKAPLDTFKDVSSKAWYYDEMAKAVEMGIFQGDEVGLKPNNPILREEAFAVIARAFIVEESLKAPQGYTDLSNISSWAKDSIYGLIDAGYIKGNKGKINPKETITRAEFAQLMDNMIKDYINTLGIHDTVKEGNVVINVPGVILKHLAIDGDLVLADGIGTGNVILDNVEVKGKIILRGGEDGLRLNGDSYINKIVVSSKTTIEVTKNARVKDILVLSNDVTIKGEGAVENVEIIKGLKNVLVETKNTNVKEISNEPVKPSETPKDKENLQRKVSQKVREDIEKLNTDLKSGEVSFRDKVVLVEFENPEDLLKIEDTGIMVLLAEIDEIVGYEINNAKRSFYENNKRLSHRKIRDMIREDIKANLSIDKDIPIIVNLEDGSVKATDEYRFRFKLK